jgi:uncharacterized protein YggU (UPF0235/DUF167 family)
LTPKAGADEVRGVEAAPDGARLKVAVRALANKGEANAALIRTLARWLRMPASAISLTSGAKSRSKTIAISGDPNQLLARLVELTRNP